MIRLLCACAAMMLALGCEPPEEAPEELGEPSLYLYQHFTDGTDEQMAAGVLGLEEYLVTVDLTADAKDRAVTLPKLTEEFLGDTVAPPDADVDLQVPVGVTGQSANDMTSALELLTDPNQVCIANNGYTYYMRSFDGDIDAFESGSAATVAATAEIRYESFLAKVWIDEYQDFRRFDLGDGRTAVLQRGYIDEQFLSDNESSSWDQRYALNVWLPVDGDESKTWRFLGFWSSVQIPGISDDAYSNLVVDGIEEGFVNEDAFVAGEECSNDRDAEYDRE
jgi:hypothetical protein